MKEGEIVRTTLYLPRSLHIAVKSKDLNLSKLIRSFLEQIIEEDEEDIILREIERKKQELKQLEAKLKIIREKKKKENAEKQYIIDVATKIAEFLTVRFKNFLQASKEYRLVDTNHFIAGTIDLVEKNYGIFIEYDEMVKLLQKVNGNGSKIDKEDILPYVVKQKEVKVKYA